MFVVREKEWPVLEPTSSVVGEFIRDAFPRELAAEQGQLSEVLAARFDRDKPSLVDAWKKFH